MTCVRDALMGKFGERCCICGHKTDIHYRAFNGQFVCDGEGFYCGCIRNYDLLDNSKDK